MEQQDSFPRFYAIAAMIWGLGIVIALLFWLIEVLVGASMPRIEFISSIVPPMVVGQIIGSKNHRVMPSSLRWRATIAYSAVGLLLLVFFGILEFAVYDEGEGFGIRGIGVWPAVIIAALVMAVSVVMTYYLLLFGENQGIKAASKRRLSHLLKK